MAVAGPIAAHPLPLEVVVYLKAAGSGIRAAVRMPAAFLADARLPRREDGYLDLSQIDGVMGSVAAYVGRTLDVTIDGRSLPPVSAAWSLSRGSDAVPDDIQAAFARAASPHPLADARSSETMVVDLAFEYALPGGVDPSGRLSLRVNDFRAGSQNVQMRVVDQLEDGSVRAIVTQGTPRRIDLNPGPFDVLALFARRGLEHVRLTGPIALFLLCLATARRSLNETVGHFAVFASGCVVALGAATMAAGSAPFLPELQAGAAVLLVVAALQNITRSRGIWIRAVALAFGVLEGLILGAAFASDAPLAGTHAFAAFLSFAAPVVAAALLLLLVARWLVDAVCRTRLQERWAVLLLSAIPIHSGLHGVLGIMGS
jgi:hypothetical protein